MARTGVEYFSWGVFSSSTGTAVNYFTDGWFAEDIKITSTGITELFVDGMFNDAGISAENIFSFGLFSGALAVTAGPELIWAHIMGQKKIQDQAIPL